jgi:hypothetical protein
MRRTRILGTMAIAAGMIAAPLAVATGGHHTPAPSVHFTVRGVADAAATCTTPEGVLLDNTSYIPVGIGTKGSQLQVSFDGATKFVGARGHARSCASIKAGDRLTVMWSEHKGTAFSNTLPATRVIDNGPPPPVHYFAVGVADTASVCTTPEGVTLDHTTFRPKSIGTKGAQLPVMFNGATKFTGHRGHALACASVKAGDRLTVIWTEPHGTAFSNTLPATHVIDNGQKHHHV